MNHRTGAQVNTGEKKDTHCVDDSKKTAGKRSWERENMSLIAKGAPENINWGSTGLLPQLADHWLLLLLLPCCVKLQWCGEMSVMKTWISREHFDVPKYGLTTHRQSVYETWRPTVMDNTLLLQSTVGVRFMISSVIKMFYIFTEAFIMVFFFLVLFSWLLKIGCV